MLIHSLIPCLQLCICIFFFTPDDHSWHGHVIFLKVPSIQQVLNTVYILCTMYLRFLILTMLCSLEFIHCADWVTNMLSYWKNIQLYTLKNNFVYRYGYTIYPSILQSSSDPVKLKLRISSPNLVWISTSFDSYTFYIQEAVSNSRF